MGDDGRLASIEAQAHRTYYEQKSGIAALALWRMRIALGQPSLEAQLALAHCEIEAGVDPELPPIGVKDPAEPAGGRLRDYLELILTCAWTYFDQGDSDRATKLLRLIAGVDPHFRSVYERQILPPGAPTSGRLPEPDPAPLPFERHLPPGDDEAARARIARHGRGMVMFTLWHRIYRDQMFEYSYCRQLRATLESLGVPVHVVEAYRLEYAQHLRIHETLRAAIAEHRPSVVLLTDPVVSGATSYGPLQDGIFAVLEEARRTLGCKVVFSYSDTWYGGMRELVDSVAGLADAIHLPSPTLLSGMTPAQAARVFCYPLPVEAVRPVDAPGTGRHLRASFVGSIGWANLSRLVWCAEIQRAGLPVDLHLTKPGTFRELDEYAALLAEHAIALNLSARTSGARITTGRSVEAPFFGSLLLEEAVAGTAYFMRPYEHFVPFSTLAELTERLELLRGDAALRRHLTAAGSAWARRHFGALPFWSRLFYRLFETELPPLPQPAQHFRSVTLRIPHSAQSYFELAQPLDPDGDP